MIPVKQFRDLIVDPTLKALGAPWYSPAAVKLLVLTAIIESNLRYLKQWPTGPALGMFQMEPSTYNDIWRYLREVRNTELRKRIAIVNVGNAMAKPVVHRLIWDLRFATCMTRVRYWMVPQALPDVDDAWGMAHYWKDHYNTHLGAGDPEKFVATWETHNYSHTA